LDWLRETVEWRTIRFAKYQPARRLGTRRVEARLLRHLARSDAWTAH
jgi:hypothetical protein